jgi:hypothetical protein
LINGSHFSSRLVIHKGKYYISVINFKEHAILNNDTNIILEFY